MRTQICLHASRCLLTFGVKLGAKNLVYCPNIEWSLCLGSRSLLVGVGFRKSSWLNSPVSELSKNVSITQKSTIRIRHTWLTCWNCSKFAGMHEIAIMWPFTFRLCASHFGPSNPFHGIPPDGANPTGAFVCFGYLSPRGCFTNYRFSSPTTLSDLWFRGRKISALDCFRLHNFGLSPSALILPTVWLHGLCVFFYSIERSPPGKAISRLFSTFFSKLFKFSKTLGFSQQFLCTKCQQLLDVKLWPTRALVVNLKLKFVNCCRWIIDLCLEGNRLRHNSERFFPLRLRVCLSIWR